MSNSAPRPVIVGIGEVLWDLLPGGKALGGAPGNFTYHAGVLGAEAHLVSCVGDDLLGREAEQSLSAKGLERTFISIDPDHPTGTVDVELDRDGKPTFTIHENVAWDFIRWTDSLAELAARTQAVCFGTLAQRCEVSRQTIRTFVETTPEDCLRIFDINIRQSFYDPETVRWMLERCQVLKLNEDELPILARLLQLEGSRTAQLDRLLGGYHLQLLVLTRGSHGSLLRSPGGGSDHPGSAVEVADTVGAGDAFTAAVAVGILNGHELEKLNRDANTLAGYVCTQHGAMPDVPKSILGAFARPS